MSVQCSDHARQRGFVAVLLLVALVMGSLYALLTNLNTATAEVSARRDQITAAALAQARDALVAYAALDKNQPGNLICPDLNNDGEAEVTPLSCTNSNASNVRVGRLPWKTLKLADLRDGSGERLWYALSANYRPRDENTINSSEPNGALRIVGTAPANEVIAVIIAPGGPLGNQVRDAANVNTVSNYLEGENNYLSDPGGISNDVFAAMDPSGTFNDTVRVITREDLFPTVENAVRRRIEQEVAPVLEAYRAAWGAYPFAAPFDGRPTSVAPVAGGVVGTLGGLLPIDAPALNWDCAGASVVKVGGSGSIASIARTASAGLCSLAVNYASPDVADPLKIKITLSSSSAAQGFYGRYCAATKTVRWDMAEEVDADNSSCAGTGSASVAPSPLYTLPFLHAMVTGSADRLLATGGREVDYFLTAEPLQAWIQFDMRAPITSKILSEATASASAYPEKDLLKWYFENDWHKVTYYRIAEGCAPGGAGCGAPPTLGLSVETATSPAPAPARAVLVLAGIPLSRPKQVLRQGAPAAAASLAAYLDAYFEGENNDAAAPPLATGTFSLQPRSPTFNDKLVVVP